MLAGLIRDEERTVMNGIPGLSDLPLIGRLFASNRKQAHESDIVLTLTPHIVRVLDLSEADLRPFRLGRDATVPPSIELPRALPRDLERDPSAPPRDEEPSVPGTTSQPAQPGTPAPSPFGGSPPPIVAPAPPAPPKKGGGSILPLD
jgi:general secretion pathway protein D